MQYGTWLKGVATGNIGTSLVAQEPVTKLLGDRVRNSAILVLLAALVSVPLSLLIGSLAGLLRDRWFDSTTSSAPCGLAALPEFVIGLLLVIAVFATPVFHVLPAVSYVQPRRALVGQLNISSCRRSHWCWRCRRTSPASCAPPWSRCSRASTCKMARLKGMPERIVLRRHALPNAVVPAIQVIALNLAWLAGGVVVVEYVFNYPGIGTGLIDAVSNRDVPVIQAIVLLIAGLYVGFNLLADILQILISPRQRTGLQ